MADIKKYTVEELNFLTRTKSAVTDKAYIDINGLQYLGTNQGTLIFLQKAVNTPIDDIFNLNSENVGGALKELAEKVNVIEIDYVTEEELNNAIEASSEDCKAFSLAMSLIF